MADSRELNIVLTMQDRASKNLEAVKGKLETLQPAFKKMAIVGTAAFAGISAVIATSVSETIKAEAAQNRLKHILQTATGATDDQVRALYKQAEALEKIGVIAGDSIIQAQAQLATFDLQAESIERLIPAILDYVVAEKGAAATTEDLKSLTNGLAQALQGNFASLTRTGFVLDDATKALIENGTEAERTAALVQVLNSTYEGFNAAARDTAEGSLIALRNEFDKLREKLGAAFLPALQELADKLVPIITKIAEWVEENPKLTATIIATGAAVTAIIAILGTLGLILPGVITSIKALGAALMWLNANPIAIIITAIGLVIIWLTYLWKHSDEIRNRLIEIWTVFKQNMVELWEGIKYIFKSAVDWIGKQFEPLINVINSIQDALANIIATAKEIGGGVIGGIKSGFSKVKNFIGLAEGGIVTKPTLAVVGEGNEPEAVMPLSKLNQFAGGSGGGITIIVNGDVSGMELVDKVREAISKDIKRRLRI